MSCDCCERAEQLSVGVAASGIGAFSISWCRECLDNCAEPVWAVETVLDMNKGLDGCAEWFKEVRVFKNGKYISVAELVSEGTINGASLRK